MPSSEQGPSPRRSDWWWTLPALLVAGGLAYWILGEDLQRRLFPAPPSDLAPEPAAIAPAAPPRVWRPRERQTPAPGCRPRASRRCLEGDAWWVDSCGQPHEQAEECGFHRCEAGQCEEDPPDCGGEPILGRCDGEVARGCEAGRPYEIDCAVLDEHCVMTEEGPICRQVDAECVGNPTQARCEGTDLVACVEGELRRVDCRTVGGICGRPAGARSPVCVQTRPPVMDEACGACGCPPEQGKEVCDGRDNDGDRYIDENDDCGEIDIVAFVIGDAKGQGSYAPEDIEAEIVRVNEAFAREDDYGLKFRLAEVIRLAEPTWLELDGSDLDEILHRGAVNPQREQFYVPIIFTDALKVNSAPRPGLATGPNGMCGGQRRFVGRQPPLGLVAVAKRRWETTVAHEIGHFLGLCHTHADQPDAVQRVIPSEQAGGGQGEGGAVIEGEVCQESCATQEDGICDTPIDPGPSICTVDQACSVQCEDGSVPDPRNIMGYYPSCRSIFSEQQMLLMRQTLALRRGWHRCIWGEGCSCTPVEGGCPEGMSCRAYTVDGADVWRCALDGSSVPGGVCEGSLQCSLGSQCVLTPSGEGRCVRPCGDQTLGCQCTEVTGIDYPVCINELEGSLGGE